MIYCRNRGQTSCCFVDEKCGRDYVAINDEMTQQAVDFMLKPQSFVSNLVEKGGYQSCHRTKGNLHYFSETTKQSAEISVKKKLNVGFL